MEEKNHILTFKSNIKDSDVVKFVKKLFSLVEEKKLHRIQIFFDENDVLENFYEPLRFFYEITDNKLKILYFCESYVYMERIKIEIDNSDVTKMLNELFVSYLDIIKDKTSREFFKQNFYTANLIFNDIDSILEDAESIQSCNEASLATFHRGSSKKSKKMRFSNDLTFTEHENISKKNLDLKIPFIVFKLCLNTEYFKNYLKKLLEKPETEGFHPFKAVLSNLGICLQVIKKIFTDSPPENCISDSDINETVALYLIKRIELFVVKSDIVNYKNLILFFCQLIQHDSRTDDFFKNIQFFINKHYLRKLRINVVKKLNKLLLPIFSSACHRTNENMILDFFDEREEVLQDN